MRSVVAGVLISLLSLTVGSASVAAQTTEADVFVAQAILDFDEQRYDEALANLRRALELEPDNLEALYYSGVVHMARNAPVEAVPFLERARARAPANATIAFQLGLAYFASQDYARARPLLEEAFRGDPTQDGLGYYVGFMRYRLRDYQGAVRAFRASRSSNPEIEQLTRFYTGLALGILGLPGQAAAEVEQSLRLVPASPLTGPAERLRDTLIAARQRERRLSLEARLGFFFDDNVAVIPDADRREPLVPELRRQRHQSTGELAGLRADYVWYRSAAWESTVGASLFGTYNNDLTAFNVIDVLGNLGLLHKTTVGRLPAQVGGQYAFDTLFLDGEEFIRRHTVSALGALVESERHLTQAFVRYQNKEFNETQPLPPEEDRDADNWMIGGLHLLRFARDRHYLKVGYQFDVEDAEGRHFAYRGHRLLAGGQYTLPWWAIRLRYDFDVHWRGYVSKHSLLPTLAPGTRRRRDTEFTNIVRAEVPLPYRLTFAAEYQSTAARSNLAVFDYSRNVFSAILSWSY